jgi:hypothetical protein
MEEKADMETAAERQMREFNESYQARMRRVMSSQRAVVCLIRHGALGQDRSRAPGVAEGRGSPW